MNQFKREKLVAASAVALLATAIFVIWYIFTRG